MEPGKFVLALHGKTINLLSRLWTTVPAFHPRCRLACSNLSSRLNPSALERGSGWSSAIELLAIGMAVKLNSNPSLAKLDLRSAFRSIALRLLPPRRKPPYDQEARLKGT